MEKILRETLTGGAFCNVAANVSKNMAAIRSHRTKTTEIKFQQALTESGITNFQANVKMPGNPDIYFPTYRLAIFLDGCFWHGCPKCGHIPKTNSEYWHMKILRNKQRDELTRLALRKEGIVIVQFWEHELKKNVTACVDYLSEVIEDNLIIISHQADVGIAQELF